jgi:hypothetical protein
VTFDQKGVSVASTHTHDELGERSFADLAKQLSEDVARLVRKEAELARAEITDKASRLAKGAAFLAVAAVFGLVMLGALTAAAILGLATTLATWLSALIVAAAVGVVAGMFGLIGLRIVKRASAPIPAQAVQSVKEDIEWLKTQAKSGAR